MITSDSPEEIASLILHHEAGARNMQHTAQGRHQPTAREPGGLVTSDVQAEIVRFLLAREDVVWNQPHTAQELPVVTAVQLFAEVTAVDVLPAGAAVDALPVATAVDDLLPQYAQPVLQRQSGWINRWPDLGEATLEVHHDPADSGVEPELAERPPLHRETGVVRPSDLFLNPGDGEPGSWLQLP